MKMMGNTGSDFQRSFLSRRKVITTVISVTKYLLDEKKKLNTVVDVMGDQLSMSGINVSDGIVSGQIDLRRISWLDPIKQNILLIPFSKEGYNRTGGKDTHVIQIMCNQGASKDELIGYDFEFDAVDGKSKYVAKIAEGSFYAHTDISGKYDRIIRAIEEGLNTDANELLGSFASKELAGAFEVLEAYAEREDVMRLSGSGRT